MAVVKKRGVDMAESVLHDKDANVAHININIIVRIKGVGAAVCGRCRRWKRR